MTRIITRRAEHFASVGGGAADIFVTDLVSECSRFGSVVASSLLNWVKMQGKVSIFHHSVTQQQGFLSCAPGIIHSIITRKLVKGHEYVKSRRWFFRQKKKKGILREKVAQEAGTVCTKNLQLP